MQHASKCVRPVSGTKPPMVVFRPARRRADRVPVPVERQASSVLASATAAPASPSLNTPRAPEATITDPALVRRAVKAAALGNAMEWFDFGVYSYIAVTLGKVFFPSGNPTAQLLS